MLKSGINRDYAYQAEHSSLQGELFRVPIRETVNAKIQTFFKWLSGGVELPTGDTQVVVFVEEKISPNTGKPALFIGANPLALKELSAEHLGVAYAGLAKFFRNTSLLRGAYDLKFFNTDGKTSFRFDVHKQPISEPEEARVLRESIQKLRGE